MILIEWDYRDTLEYVGLTMSQRKLNGILKSVNHAVLWTWAQKFLPKHFTREAYARYPEAYPKQKKRGDPMVRSGTLRTRVLKQAERPLNIRANARGASLMLKFGRPKGMTKATLLAATSVEMNLHPGMDFKTAQRRVYSRAGFGARNVAFFKRAIEAFSEEEKGTLADMALAKFRQLARERGQSRAYTSKGAGQRFGGYMANSLIGVDFS